MRIVPIEGYEGRYSVTDDGRVISHNYSHTGRDRDLKPGIARGYLHVTLYINGKANQRKVHRLVALAFIPNPEIKPEVNHKDGNKANNVWTNLEWSTRKENNDHSVTNGLWEYFGESHHKAKLTEQNILEIRANNASDTMLSAKFGVKRHTIKRARIGETWSHTK